VQNDMSTAVMWSKSKPDVVFQYGGRLGEFNGMSSQSHVSRRVLPLGEFTVTIPEPHATLHDVRITSAILKIVFRHILLFCFYCSLGFDERRLSYRLRYTCVLSYNHRWPHIVHTSLATCCFSFLLIFLLCFSNKLESYTDLTKKAGDVPRVLATIRARVDRAISSKTLLSVPSEYGLC